MRVVYFSYILIFLSSSIIAQPTIEWTKTFGGSGGDSGQDIVQTSDGGFIICGITQSYGAGQEDVYLVKTNNLGQLSWYRTFGGNLDDVAYSIRQTTDGGFIICGFTKSFGNNGDIYLIKTNSNGQQSWMKYFGGPGWDVGYCVRQISDGGYIIAGVKEVVGSSPNIYIIKTNSLGVEQWSRDIYFDGSSHCSSIEQTNDGGFILGAEAYDIQGQDIDVKLIKLNSSGSTIWIKSFGEAMEDYTQSVIQSNNGGYVICGTQRWPLDQTLDIFLLKTNSSGDLVWSKRFGEGVLEDEWASNVKQTADAGFIISASTYANGYFRDIL